MGDHVYFQKALADFTYEAASGGAIRHLADSGYTVKQIVEKLDFPMSYERVQKAVWTHLVGQGVILLDRPGSGRKKEKAAYVREYDRYGKATFRRIVETEEEEPIKDWKEQLLSSTEDQHTGTLSALLEQKIRENGIDNSYASFSFGLLAMKNPAQYETILALLDAHQREYVSGLPWVRGTVYHRLDFRMAGVLTQLCNAAQYEGECCFVKSRENYKIEGLQLKG